MNIDVHPLYLRACRERDESRAERDESRAERDALLRDRDAVALELACMRSALAHLIDEFRNGHVQTEQPETWDRYNKLARGEQ